MAATRQNTSTKTAGTGLLIVGAQGASLASAATITVTDSIHTVTGSTTINTINGGTAGQVLWLIKPTGATWAFGTSGNLVLDATYTPAANRAIQLFTANGTTWQLATIGDDKVDVSGDTMTGALTIDAGSGTLLYPSDPSGIASWLSAGSAVLKLSAEDSADGAGLWLNSDTKDWFVGIDDATTDKFYIDREGTQRLTIDASGRVGIGNASPSYNLDVSGTLRLTSYGGTTSTSGFFVGNGTAFDGANYERVSLGFSSNVAILKTDSAGTGTARDLAFHVGTERMRIDTSGRVGINATPAAGEQFVSKAGGTSTWTAAFENSGGTNIGGFFADGSSHGAFYVKNSSGTTKLTLDGSDGSIKEYGRSFVQGAWTTPTFSAGDYAAVGGGSWTVASGDVNHYSYTIIGKTMTVSFDLTTTTVGATANYLTIAVPASATAAKDASAAIWIKQGAVYTAGRARVIATESVIRLYTDDTSAWTATTNLTDVCGQISFEIT